ncbi:MAG: hypothetical protein HFF18_04255 [Oscillospiraceae bacterium]|nr:hypothetical protein [Oscillospiraceae bacterium]
MAGTNKKAIGLEELGVAVNEIKKTYPTKEQVTQQIANAGVTGITFATEEEVLALFAGTPSEEGQEVQDV